MASDSDSKIGDFKKIAAGISDEQVLKLEQAAIRIPSTTFEEGEIADHFANYMSDVGLDVEMRDVTHPAKPGKTARQPIARLRGTGGGPSLMLNGHMDPGVEMSGWSVDPYGAKFEDGWVWGMGAHDDKGGVVAAICAVEAIVRAGVRLRGDGNMLMAHGIPRCAVRRRRHRIYKEWPTPDERVPLKDLVTAAKAIAYATHQLCA
jgi:acetylornithine deacetylase/succinyl-diaminopimelate desuccinylase-like protein